MRQGYGRGAAGLGQERATFWPGSHMGHCGPACAAVEGAWQVLGSCHHGGGWGQGSCCPYSSCSGRGFAPQRKQRHRIGWVRPGSRALPQVGLWFPHLGSPATVAGWLLGLPSFLPPSAPPPLLHLKLQAASGRRQDRWQGGCTKHRIYYQAASWPRSLGTGPQFRPMAPASPRAGVGRHCPPGACGVDRWAEPWLSVTTEPWKREAPPSTVAPRLPPCWSQSPWSSAADSFCHHPAHPSGRGGRAPQSPSLTHPPHLLLELRAIPLPGPRRSVQPHLQRWPSPSSPPRDRPGHPGLGPHDSTSSLCPAAHQEPCSTSWSVFRSSWLRKA